MRRVLFIENHDSFSWNVIDALPFDREAIEVVGAAQASARLADVDAVVMGPGPKDPVRAGLVALVQEVARRGLPFLGVCLGHQALGLAFGATLVRSEPTHGKRAQVAFEGARRLLNGPMEVMRYHSLSLRDVGSPLRVVGALGDGTVMAVEHESLPMAGVQFHPDSFGTPRGRELLAHFFSRFVLPAGERAGEPRAQSLSPAREGAGEQSRREPLAHSLSPAGERADTIALSSLRSRTSFALLAPAFTDSAHWTLFEPGEGPSSLLFISAESRIPIRLTGTARAVEPLFDVPAARPEVSLDEAGFLSGVHAIRERIAAGDVYQVNLTLRATLSGVGGGELLSTLCARAVPRFAAWVRTPELGELVSASPELLCEQRDRVVRVEPMKGTAPPDQRAWLEQSEKDRAELAMITDLLRDDLHRLCVPSTVQVRDERRFIELPYVVQAVSDVEGVLPGDVTFRDVLRGVHPGGSVTGAPREAALEVIAALEPSPRGAYCGTLALEHDGLARAALLIRTAEKRGDSWRYGVGSGITWDSDPQAELDEVRLKLGALR